MTVMATRNGPVANSLDESSRSSSLSDLEASFSSHGSSSSATTASLSNLKARGSQQQQLQLQQQQLHPPQQRLQSAKILIAMSFLAMSMITFSRERDMQQHLLQAHSTEYLTTDQKLSVLQEVVAEEVPWFEHLGGSIERQEQQVDTAKVDPFPNTDKNITQPYPSLERIPLHELVQLSVHDAPLSCPQGMLPAPQVSNLVADHAEGRKIPKVLHMTGKSLCLTQKFYDNALAWQFPGHSFYFHDDAAVDQLLFSRHWPMFPQLQNSFECLKNSGGAAKADLWRYLVLWEYGGIYTDMDNAPGELFNETTIDDDLDAFFLQERGGFLSQYFFAVSPKHPLMFLAVHDVMRKLHDLDDTGKFYVPEVTGPGAIKRAFLRFMGYKKDDDVTYKKYAKPNAGHYVGVVDGNRTVDVVGTRSTCGRWVRRPALGGRTKKDGWKKMNITGYQGLNKVANGRSCVMKLFDKYEEPTEAEVLKELHRRRW